jgi:hypothetical protein
MQGIPSRALPRSAQADGFPRRRIAVPTRRYESSVKIGTGQESAWFLPRSFSVLYSLSALCAAQDVVSSCLSSWLASPVVLPPLEVLWIG